MADFDLSDGEGIAIRQETGSPNKVHVDLEVSSLDDINEALEDVDTLPIDNADSGSPKKSTLSRVWTYIKSKIQNSSDISISILDIDSSTDIGEDLDDSDLFIVDNGAGGTNRKSAVSRLWDYVTGKASSVNAQTGTAYTLVIGDSFRPVTLNNAAAITLTVPTNASVAYKIGTQIPIVQMGAGQVTVAGDSGVTVNVNSAQTLKLTGQYAGATLIKLATDEWVVIGNMEATA